jgi:pyridinium-3,5-bisthiocarboxylic acid mononucleotide nickel chelatase
VGEQQALESRHVELLTLLATDVDDMPAEHLAEAADALRDGGALDVVLLSTQMKKGRVGTRVEVLARPLDVPRLEGLLFAHTTTLGVRRLTVERRALARRLETVRVLGHDVRVKIAALPDGGHRAKPEFEDLRVVSSATGRSLGEVASLALAAAERV